MHNVNSFNNQIYSYMTDKSQLHQAANTFSLIRLKPECKILPTRVDFSTTNISPSTQTSITPSFNNDRTIYTPSFTLPLDNKYYRENAHFQKCQFEEKIQRSLRETSSLKALPSEEVLMAVAPHSKYCQICQEKFEDYFAHIQLKTHGIRVSNTDASEKIQQLCSEFQSTQIGDSGKGKSKPIKKEQRREQKKVKGGKTSSSTLRSISTIQGLTNLQNHSTGIIEDTLV